MLIRWADGQSTMIDFREKAPGKATRTMFLDSAGNLVPRRSEYGPLAAGVPGSVAGYLYALERYGTLTRGRVLSSAVHHAENGFPLSERVARGFRESLKDFAGFPSTMEVFSRKGVPYGEGDLFRQHDLAATLRTIVRKGRDGFYQGDVAEMIVAEMRRSGGIISMEDLAEYRVVERPVLQGSYREYRILTASPPSAGGVVLLEMLNILEGYNLQRRGHNSSAAIHLFAAAAQRAYADRSVYLGDPDFAKVPVERLASKEFARLRAQGIDTGRAAASAAIGPASSDEVGPFNTTHVCVADSFGNVVALTTTLNDLYGCKTVVRGAGFFLNNEMDDFVAKPGTPNLYGLTGGDANAIAPHKRMLSSMTPTVVLKDDKPFLVLGARGGGRITTAVANIIINVVDFGLDIQEAVESPRIHYQWLPDRIFHEPNGLQADVMQNLREMGYALEETSFNGRAHAILIDAMTRVFYGAPDPREEGVALGY